MKGTFNAVGHGKILVWLVIIPLCQLTQLMGGNFIRISDNDLVTDLAPSIGCAWGDYDGDGFIDAVVANTRMGLVPNESNALYLYHNEGNGSFVRITEGELATDSVSAMNPVWADYDNDGDLDLFSPTHFNLPDVFYRNEGNGSFTKITEGEWVTRAGTGTTAAWGDIDNDGWVDLYVTNSGTPPQENFMYTNSGDGLMASVATPPPGIASLSHGCTWSDYDLDGDVDLFVGGQEVLLFRNDGAGVFTGIPEANGGIPKAASDQGFSIADYDNDGDFDVLYTTWNAGIGFQLFRNDQAAGFTEVTGSAFDETTSIVGAGSAWGDYDNDGFLDLYIASNPAEGGRNLLYHNSGDGILTRVTETVALNQELKSMGCAWVDYDNDGQLDLFIANGAAFNQPCELYRNEGGVNNWLKLDLKGTNSNRSAIGAKAIVSATINGQPMTQIREVCGGGSGNYSQGDLRLHFGLRDASVVETLRIEWPSGTVQVLHDVDPNQIMAIEEVHWAGYPIPENGWIDTSSWMGWLYVKEDPWIWCADLSKWLYCPGESIDANGTWAYLPM